MSDYLIHIIVIIVVTALLFINFLSYRQRKTGHQIRKTKDDILRRRRRNMGIEEDE